MCEYEKRFKIWSKMKELYTGRQKPITFNANLQREAASSREDETVGNKDYIVRSANIYWHVSELMRLHKSPPK